MDDPKLMAKNQALSKN